MKKRERKKRREKTNKQQDNNQIRKQTNNQGDNLNQKERINKVIAQDKMNTYVHTVTQTAVNSYLDKRCDHS